MVRAILWARMTRLGCLLGKQFKPFFCVETGQPLQGLDSQKGPGTFTQHYLLKPGIVRSRQALKPLACGLM